MLASVDDDTEGDDGVGDDCPPSLTESMRPLGEAALMPGPGHARQSQAGPTPHLNTPQHSSPLNTNNRNILYVYYLDMYDVSSLSAYQDHFCIPAILEMFSSEEDCRRENKRNDLS